MEGIVVAELKNTSSPYLVDKSISNITSLENLTEIDNLLPALVQIFFTIILGYIAGYFHIINSVQSNGLHIFVGKFSLPILLFISLCKMDFSQISWPFFITIFVIKSVIFVCVLVGDFISNRDINRSAIFAIFCTQSNDFGMGLPILSAVYGSDHKFVSYLYLVAPISLLLLNPVAFICMEFGRGNVENVFVHTYGVYATRFSSALLSISLLLHAKKYYNFLDRMKLAFLLTGPLLSLLVVTSLFLTTQEVHANPDTQFQLGLVEPVAVMVVLGSSLLVLVTALVMKLTVEKGQSKEIIIVQLKSDSDIIVDNVIPEPQVPCQWVDAISPKTRSDVDHESTYESKSVDMDSSVPRVQMFRHTLLLLILSLSMMTGFVLSFWTFLAQNNRDTFTGVYQVLVYIDSFLNIGQGILIFIVFGLSAKLILRPIKTRWKHLTTFFPRRKVPREEYFWQL